MKKEMLLLFGLCLVQLAAAQKKVPITELDIFNGVTYQRYHQEPFSGVGIEYYANNKKRKELNFKDGRTTGVAQEWDMQGNLVTEVTYQMGIRHGRETQFYPSGKKQLEVFYDNGKANGTVTEWYEDGVIMSRGEVLQGKYYGKHTWWYKDGKTEQVIEYRNGVAEGKVEQWYDNGNMRKSTEFSGGQPNGLSVEWYKEGGKMNEQQFVKGQPHGDFRHWGKDGRLLEWKVFERGEVVKMEDYNSASLRYKNGYAYIFNLLNSNFVLKMTGEKVEPVSAGGLAFFVDGVIVQFVTAAVTEFQEEGEVVTDEALWQRFLEDEKNRVEYQLDTNVIITQKTFTLANGYEGVFWQFDLPVEIARGKLKILQEQYAAIRVQNHFVQANGLVLNSLDNSESTEKALLKILETLEVSDKPIDVVQYTRTIVEGRE